MQASWSFINCVETTGLHAKSHTPHWCQTLYCYDKYSLYTYHVTNIPTLNKPPLPAFTYPLLPGLSQSYPHLLPITNFCTALTLLYPTMLLPPTLNTLTNLYPSLPATTQPVLILHTFTYPTLLYPLLPTANYSSPVHLIIHIPNVCP